MTPSPRRLPRSPRPRPRAVRALLIALALAGAALPLPASRVQAPERTPAAAPQPAATPDQRDQPSAGAARADRDQPARHVLGRVVRQGDRDVAPVAAHWVTLHRVGSDTAGPLDSVRTDSMGRFAFAYRLSGAPDAVYFVSATYAGIAYFSQPLTQPVVRGANAEITVFDTTSHPVTLRVRGRHLIVGAPARAGLRSVVEVFELSNDTSVTLVAASAGDRPTWTVAVPAAAVGFRLGQGDVPPDAVTVRRGRAEVFAPFAPGLKQFSFSYELPSSAFPLSRPLAGGATIFEVLLEETEARVDAPRVRELAPVAVEGRTFRRYLAQDLPPGATARVTVPFVLGDRRGLYFALVLTAIGAAMLAALALAFRATPRRAGSLAGGGPAR